VSRYETALDDLIMADVIDIANDDKFFVFQDIIEQSTMMFFRDRAVLDMMKSKPHLPILGIGNQEKLIGAFMPNGMLPCQNFAKYLAPFCYISDKREDCYYIFRGFWCKYFCYLHSVSSHPQSMISLCKLFEDLL